MYIKQGEHWYKCYFKAQCKCKIGSSLQCQAHIGHTGRHWSYNQRGWFCWSENKKEVNTKDKFRGVGGQTPPGHKFYIDPKEMVNKSYVSMVKRTLITNKKKIERLENGEYEEGAALAAPVSLGE